jgi:hypothetical protein
LLAGPANKHVQFLTGLTAMAVSSNDDRTD